MSANRKNDGMLRKHIFCVRWSGIVFDCSLDMGIGILIILKVKLIDLEELKNIISKCPDQSFEKIPLENETLDINFSNDDKRVACRRVKLFMQIERTNSNNASGTSGRKNQFSIFLPPTSSTIFCTCTAKVLRMQNPSNSLPPFLKSHEAKLFCGK